MKSLSLFNAVIAKFEEDALPFVSTKGYIIMPGAHWAKDEIERFWDSEKLSGTDLNKTFHKSWLKVIDSTREELLIDQIMHYLSTYGTNFEGEIYIPEEVLNVPNLKIVFKVFRGYAKEELSAKALNMLKSGIALTTETIDDLLGILVSDLDYKFTGDEGIRNREAIVKIADAYGIIPKDTMEFFRYIIYRMTNDTLIIKNKESIELIRESSFNPVPQFNIFGLEKLAEIFNRFKPLFLAMKPKHSRTINRISKLSKTLHKPLVSNPVNFVTSILLDKSDYHWLDNATPFALFKAMSACYARIKGQKAFLYRIRNGKSWVKENSVNESVVIQNFSTIVNHLKNSFNMDGKKFYFPKNVLFALPTSEKLFVGNFPTGTKFIGENLAIGIYWEDSWGASDLDLSGLNIGGKIGWNAYYSRGSGELVYSGDITSAPSGAVEYLHAREGLSEPTLVMNNVYTGDDNSGYKIIVGLGSDVSNDYMMNPNNLFAEIKTEAVQKNMVLGIIIPEGEKQSFVLLNFGAGHSHVSGNSDISNLATKALFEQWKAPLSFNEFVVQLGGVIVEDSSEADFNFSLDSLEKDSFTKIFE